MSGVGLQELLGRPVIYFGFSRENQKELRKLVEALTRLNRVGALRTVKKQKARGKPKGMLKDEIRIAILERRQRPTRSVGVGRS